MTFNDYTIKQVWLKAIVVAGYDSNLWRKDQYGAWIGRGYYGDRNSQYGWEIDHIRPKSHGGGDELSNLRPLQWENNVARQSGSLR